MVESFITQAEADLLIQMEKLRVDDTIHGFPVSGSSLDVFLKSRDGREEFILHIYKGRRDLRKITYQNMARKIVILIRLDLKNSHLNPDGEEIPAPHIHLYREGFDDKWAFPVDGTRFPDLNDPMRTLQDFMDYCNITEKPIVSQRLF